MTINNWPLTDRPREKMLSKGAKNVSDAELLAIFLRTGAPGKSALDIARDLLNEYGSLKKLFSQGPKQFFKQKGIGAAKYAMLMAALELGCRYYEEEVFHNKSLNNSDSTKRFIQARL